MRNFARTLFALCFVPCVAQAANSAKPSTTQPAPRSVTMRGVIYEDLNANGVRDDGEPPLAGMPVSDGLVILRTPADGRFEFVVHEDARGSVFVCTPAGWRGSKTFFVITDFDRFDGKTQPADLGLVRDAARSSDRFCFVQISDTHVIDDPKEVEMMAADLETANRVSDGPLFIVATGDEVRGDDKFEEVVAFVKATRDTRVPLYNIVGNHDYGGKLRSTENYEKLLGPQYYSFDVGPYHFISQDIVARDRNKPFFERQSKWIEQDLRLNAVGQRVVVFQHYIPTIPELDKWATHNTRAVFSGHWHGRRERLYKGILDINSSPLRFGGLDRSPAGFRIIHVDGEDMRCEWRLGRQHRRLEIINPPLDGEIASGEIPIRVIAYDTAIRVRNAHYSLFDGGSHDTPGSAPLAEGDLWAEGNWAWTARCRPAQPLAPGPKWLRVEVTAADGAAWTKEGAFTLTDKPAPVVTPGEPWLFFHKDLGHRGYLAAGPRPPLSVAWATHIGGTIQISSPVIADGRVYAAGSFEQSLADCAVTALDLATGRPIWRAAVDSSIKHSLAAWKDNILAVSQAGTLYCINRDGFVRWTASLDRGRNDRWETSFPVTDGKLVYAGRNTGFGAYDLLNGNTIWTREGGDDWWPVRYSGPSVSGSNVYQGGPFVRALDAASGKVRWTNDDMPASSVAVVPAAVDEHNAEGDRLYVFHNWKTLRCLDGATGKQIWEATSQKPDGTGTNVVSLGLETGTPAIGDKVVCVGGGPFGEGSSAAMHGFDKASGQMLWKFPVGADLAPSLPSIRSAATITSSPVIVGDVVYFGCSDGWFYALGASDGRLLWKYWFAVPIASTPAVSGNTVIIATWDGTIHALIGS